jgi:hypothetical protein
VFQESAKVENVSEERGKLWESWTLVREVEAEGKRERMQTDQLLLERLDGDRWRIRHIEWPRRGGRRHAYLFPHEHAARAVMDDLFAQGNALDGTWYISRFGQTLPAADYGR